MTIWSRAAQAIAFAALAACSSGQAGGQPAAAAQSAETRHPESGLPVIPLRVGRHAFRVEVASTEPEQQRGLMFRTKMGADEGMIFLRQPPDHAAFWMRNTVIPLDIIFIGKDRRILNIAHGVPYDETPLPSAGVTLAVLELNEGRAAALGIKPGDLVSW
ncbi:DUF192 domain-containing protein [Novosphingobium piscinae]|uniref:DUF192 domain-containing protein n=1 Tax=Novosphingobium piscinae TaxID=1507448 RepID=A0A7X1FWR8_9SPHN|nr:DUF192 domain-containing protein [Novosphingobium piscinae]MBC2668389.1 DUF192 domain-containing protein [Novosphingobium piscinae]